MTIEITEQEFVRRASSAAFASPPSICKNLKISKHTVAPSEYQAAYDKTSYPRSVFNKGFGGKEDVETHVDKKHSKPVSFIKRIFTKTKHTDHQIKEEGNLPSVENKKTGFIDVDFHQDNLGGNLEELAKGLEKVDERNRKNSRCLSASNYKKFKLPNAIENKIFRVKGCCFSV